MTSTREERLRQYGPQPPPSTPKYDFVKCSGRMVMTAGILSGATGPVDDVSSGKRAASEAMATLLWRLASHLREHHRAGLDAVEQILRLEGHVFSGREFVGHSAVLDGASEVLLEVFSDTTDGGRHTRVAVGASSLPNGGTGLGRALELSVWLELKP